MITQNIPTLLGARTLIYLILEKASLALKLIVVMIVITFCVSHWNQNILALQKSKDFFMIPHYFAVGLYTVVQYGWVLVSALFICLGITGLLEYDSTRFTLTNSALSVSTGMMTHKETTIPFSQVDTMDISDTPTLRMFGLCSFVIKTSAQNSVAPSKDNSLSDAILPIIPTTLAKELQNQILSISSPQKPEQAVE